MSWPAMMRRYGIDPLAERKASDASGPLQSGQYLGRSGPRIYPEDGGEGRADTTTSEANWLPDQLRPISGQPISCEMAGVWGATDDRRAGAYHWAHGTYRTLNS